MPNSAKPIKLEPGDVLVWKHEDEVDDLLDRWLEELEWRSGGAREWDDPREGGDR